eukprot:c3891_g1_i2.p1 GENE.c3891_g1_i2~~c3891_g1_i2.p1  ORF type:complete len:218 (+),score=33.87 c3891_g1_i2:90-743(+)
MRASWTASMVQACALMLAAAWIVAAQPTMPKSYEYLINATQLEGTDYFLVLNGSFSLESTGADYANVYTCVESSPALAEQCQQLPTTVMIASKHGVTQFAYNREQEQCAVLCLDGRNCLSGAKCPTDPQSDNVFRFLASSRLAGDCVISSGARGAQWTYNNTAADTEFLYCFAGNSPAVVSVSAAGALQFVDRFLSVADVPVPSSAFAMPAYCKCER